MLILYAGVIILLLKWLAIEPVASWSWWWVLSPLVAAVIWFEYLEQLFGRDKRMKEAAEWERLRQDRVKKAFDFVRGGRRR